MGCITKVKKSSSFISFINALYKPMQGDNKNGSFKQFHIDNDKTSYFLKIYEYISNKIMAYLNYKQIL